jgi:hypothetical protein
MTEVRQARLDMAKTSTRVASRLPVVLVVLSRMVIAVRTWSQASMRDHAEGADLNRAQTLLAKRDCILA